VENALEQLLRIGEKFGLFFPMLFVLENLRINAAQFPGVEKGRPINERHEVIERWAGLGNSRELRFRQIVVIEFRRVGASGCQGQKFYR
jgi:hypothetical protein